MKKSLKKVIWKTKSQFFFKNLPNWRNIPMNLLKNQHKILHLMKFLLFNGLKSLQNYLSKTKQYKTLAKKREFENPKSMNCTFSPD